MAAESIEGPRGGYRILQKGEGFRPAIRKLGGRGGCALQAPYEKRGGGGGHSACFRYDMKSGGEAA